MKNLHVIYCDWSEQQKKILSNYGIKVETKYDRFDIEENDTYWLLKPYLDEWKVQDFVVSIFSDDDFSKAKILVYSGVRANGYPMPDDDNGYMQTTYDDTNYCPVCGIGLIQKEPFRLKAIPKWGSKKIFSLNWIYDELFVKKDFFESILIKYGVESVPVLLYKKETLIENTVQIKIPTTEDGLNLQGYEFEICHSCHRKRYNLINTGFFPAFEFDADERHIFKSKEWFGTGANARKYIFLSGVLRKELIKFKIKMNYIPCDE
jgi:hypothetical protein